MRCMVDPAALLQATVDKGKRMLRAAQDPSSATAQTKPVVMVPIRSLGPQHRERIAAHLQALSPQDRYLRFGYAAQDDQIERYVSSLDFERDEIFGIFNRRLQIVAMAHLALTARDQAPACAEFGLSVAAYARGRGWGSRLFERAMLHARNEGVSMMFIHALSENTPMLTIARKAGALVERDGSETEAFLWLPQADWDSHVSELVQNRWAELDYALKVQAKQFGDILRSMRSARAGAAQDESAP